LRFLPKQGVWTVGYCRVGWIAVPPSRCYNPAVVLLRTLGLMSLLAVQLPALGTPSPALARLFTPLSVPPGTYEVFTSTEGIEALTARLRALDPAPSAGAWAPSRPEAFAAFGQDGLYDRPRLARLFNGKRVTVVRGTLARDGRHVAYTLISPYPDPTLSRIVDGTMVIAFHVPL